MEVVPLPPEPVIRMGFTGSLLKSSLQMRSRSALKEWETISHVMFELELAEWAKMRWSSPRPWVMVATGEKDTKISTNEGEVTIAR